MSNEKLDYLVFILRAQPYHLGHQSVIKQAFTLAKKVIVMIGSTNIPRDIKNPFTFTERWDMIDSDPACQGNLTGVQLIDYKYNDLQWIEQVQTKVQHIINLDGWTDYPPKVGIIGLDKDSSTRYLKWFPQWQSIEVEQYGDGSKFDATSIRNILFGGYSTEFLRGVVPKSTFDFINKFKATEEYKTLVAEYNFIKEYKKSWEAAPYAPTFVTVDAVVFQSGHVLLVKRGAEPGKGLWALPGGFVNQEERLEDAAIRELREETKLKVPEPVLRGSIFAREVFDSPDRSLRGRTITHAYGIKLNPIDKLPVVKGSDDAVKAKWVSLCDLKREEMFEDHMSIVEWFKNKL